MNYLKLKMSISLILIGIISLIVIVGTAYLLVSKHEQLADAKKSNILLIVGVVIFISFMVTSLKHPALHRSQNFSGEDYDLNQIFFPKDCKYPKENKYMSNIEISQDIINEIYGRNYLPISKRLQNEESKSYDRSQNVLFLSKKNEGATYLLSSLAETTCKGDHPTLYFKLNQNIKNDKSFAAGAGFYSYQQLQKSLCQLSGIQIRKSGNKYQFTQKSKPHKMPYLIIDNFQHLIDTLSSQTYYEDSKFDDQDDIAVQTKGYNTKQRLLTKIISNLMNKCKVNVILNSQKEEAIEQLLDIWEQSLKTAQNDIFPFEFHEWQGLKRYDIYKIVIKAIPNGDYILSKILEGSKKEHYNFNDFFNIVREVQHTISINNDQKSVLKRQDTSLRQTNIKISVARYFGLGKSYKQIRSAENKAISFLKERIPIKDLWSLEALNLISIRNGNIYIQ